MSAKLLLREFERVSDAPQAMSLLRKFLFDLAMEGRLVEQREDEEPACDLLARIKVAKGRTAAKPRTSSSSIGELPNFLPETWVWTCLAEVGFLNPRNDLPDDQAASFVPMPGISAEYGVPIQHEVRSWGEIKKGYTHFAEGDVAVAKITPCFQNGKSAVFRGLTGGAGSGTTELHVVRPVLVNPDFILIFLKSPRFIEGGIPKMTGTAGQKRLPSEYFAGTPFPLPPLAEQSRIVAKVDELMVLCDQLEQAQKERELQRDALRKASLYHLTSADSRSGKGKDARFFLNSSSRLITRDEHVSSVRQAILELAVRGKLIRQDPTNELTADLLTTSDQVRKEVSTQDRRASAIRQELLGSDLRWPVPESWEWRGFADLVLFIDYRGKTPNKVLSGVRLITAKNIRRGFVSLDPEEFISEEEYDQWMTRGLPAAGDVLFTTEAPMGNAAVVRITEKFALAQRTINFRSYGSIDPDFLVLQLLSAPFQGILEKTATGLTAKGIKAAKLKRLPITVPPLAEQRRIVAKVEQLMALCDELRETLTSGQIERGRLLDVLLHDALAGSAKVVASAVAGGYNGDRLER